jgi:hypothetical protein
MVCQVKVLGSLGSEVRGRQHHHLIHSKAPAFVPGVVLVIQAVTTVDDKDKVPFFSTLE